MLREYARVITKIMAFLDACVIASFFVLSYYIRTLINPNFSLSLMHMAALPLFVMIWLAFLYHFNIYDSLRIKKVSNIFLDLIKASCLAFFVFSSFLYVFKIQHISRIFMGLVFTFTTLGLLSEKIFYLSILRYLRRKGYNYKNILIVGTGLRAKKFIDAIEMHSEWGLRIAGLVDKDSDMKGKKISGYPVLGIFDDIPQIVHNNVVDEVVFVVPRSWLTNIEELLVFLEREGIMIHVAVDYFQLSLARAKQSQLNGFPLLTFESTPDKIWNLMLKRAIDIAVSLAGLIILSPVMLIISILVKTTSTGGVFFRQLRCGLNNRKFVLYKFRTMTSDAEKKLEELLDHNQMKGPVFKMDDDPRLTRVGRFLRKLSLDELPQFWNVLRGDMSLVGPRPPIPKEVDKYESWHRRRLSMRPGITCLWQVNGRNAITDFNQWTKLDLDYIDHWSLSLDFKIMLKTIPTVITGAGAK